MSAFECVFVFMHIYMYAYIHTSIYYIIHERCTVKKPFTIVVITAYRDMSVYACVSVHVCESASMCCAAQRNESIFAEALLRRCERCDIVDNVVLMMLMLI